MCGDREAAASNSQGRNSESKFMFQWEDPEHQEAYHDHEMSVTRIELPGVGRPFFFCWESSWNLRCRIPSDTLRMRTTISQGPSDLIA